MNMRTVLALPLACLSLLPTGGFARDAKPKAAVPAEVQATLDCQKVTDAAARLACFDRTTHSLGEAIARDDVVVADRAEVTRTRRSLFGLRLPSFGVFGGGEQDEIKQIDGVARVVTHGADGGWVVTLEDQSVWQQTDGVPLALAPRKGSKITIKRGALGSYKMNVDGQYGIKVQRIS